MKRGTKAVLAGRLGQFWECVDGEPDMSSPPIVGWLRLVDEHIEVLGIAQSETPNASAKPVSHQRHRFPQALLGVLEGETVLLLGVSSPGHNMRSGYQYMLDTVLYRARCVVVGIARPAKFNGLDLLQASVTFPGMLHWAGYEFTERETETDDRGFVKTSNIKLLPLPTVPSGRIGNGKYIDLKTRWSITESKEQISVSTGLYVNIRSKEPVPAHEMIRMLGWVQLALVLAYRAWITAEPGQAILDTPGPVDPRHPSEFWAASLSLAAASRDVPENIPWFTLADLGSARGIARWIRICQETPRVVDPLLSYFRNGSASIYDHILAMCSAIEYYAASRARQPNWTRPAGAPSGGKGKLYVLASRIGPAWTDFVGDLDRWADHTWAAYISAKHYVAEPAIDKTDLDTLTAAAETLLVAVLLNEASGSKKVSRRILDHGSLHMLRERLRSMTIG